MTTAMILTSGLAEMLLQQQAAAIRRQRLRPFLPYYRQMTGRCRRIELGSSMLGHLRA